MMKIKRTLLFIIVFALLTVIIPGFTADYSGLKVSKINFEGFQIAQKNLLKSTITLKVGDDYDAQVISESLKLLYEFGYFSEIKVDVTKDKADSVAVTFIFREHPVIKNIKYEGMKKINSTDIDEEVKKIIPEGTSENRIYSILKINQIKSLILQKYLEDGYLDTTIDVKEELDKKLNSLTITYIVNEGAKTVVREVKLTGNKIFTGKKLLSKLDTKGKDWLHPSGGAYDDIKFEMDQEKLIDFYRNNGYIKASILSAVKTTNVIKKKKGKTLKETKELDISIKIFEGDQYTFGGYTVQGYAIFPEKAVWSALKQVKGEIFNYRLFQKDMMTLQQLYAGRGYIFAQVIPDEKIDSVKKTLAYDIQIYEGEIAHVENIIVRGNSKTKENVIRRELSISEGDIFDADKIRRSQEKIFNLGFFKDVRLDVRPGSAEGLMNLIIEIEEQQTGMITLGATFSSGTGVGGYEEVSENNFLGRSYRIHERIDFQQSSKNYEVGFGSPWIFNTPTSVDFNIYYKDMIQYPTSDKAVANSYKHEEYGVSLGIGRRLNDYMKSGGSYNLTLYQDYRVGANYLYYSPGVVPGKQFFRNLFLVYYEYDSRDNVFNPTRGRYFRQSVQTSFGMENVDASGNSYRNDTFNKFTTDVGFYFPTFWKFVLICHGYLGLINDSFLFPKNPLNVKPTDKFTLGSSETVRGYSSDYIKPWPDTGFSQIYFNMEYRFPIAEQMLWGLLFLDSGNQWADSYGLDLNMQRFSYSLGIGMRIQIPMLPLRFYLSYPFSHDEKRGWHFEGNIGTPKFEFSVGGLF